VCLYNQNDKIVTEKALCAAGCFVRLTWLCRSISIFDFGKGRLISGRLVTDGFCQSVRSGLIRLIFVTILRSKRSSQRELYKLNGIGHLFDK